MSNTTAYPTSNSRDVSHDLRPVLRPVLVSTAPVPEWSYIKLLGDLYLIDNLVLVEGYAQHTGPTLGSADTLSGEVQVSLKKEIRELFEEAGVEDWDGEGAQALDEDTVLTARKVVDELPNYAGRPDVSATPHGEVDFDWVIKQDLMLTVSVGPGGKEIAYAGLFNGGRLSGCDPWTGKLPRFVRCCFERLRDCLNK